MPNFAKLRIDVLDNIYNIEWSCQEIFDLDNGLRLVEPTPRREQWVQSEALALLWNIGYIAAGLNPEQLTQHL
jgi:hypothetical protein